MNKGNLTPKTNNTIKEMRFVGGFGQPDGFNSILTVGIRQDGRLVLTLDHKEFDGKVYTWSFEADNEQRKIIGALALSYDPVLWEEVK